MVLSEHLVGGEGDHGSASGVQVSEVFVIVSPGHGVGSAQLYIRDSLGQDHLHLRLLHQHVIKDVVHQSHVQHVLGAGVEEILVRWNIVADDIVSLPASEQWEPGSKIQLHGVVHHLHVAGGDVANIISVVDVTAGGGQQSLEVLDTGHSRLFSLIFISITKKLHKLIIILKILSP